MPLQGSEICLRKGKVWEDRISGLPDDLLMHILSHVPTKYAVTTMFLSKRWRFVWTMVRKLYYSYSGKKSDWYFLDKSLQLHKASMTYTRKFEYPTRSTMSR